MGQSIETTAKNNLSAENAKLSSSATRVAEIMSTNLVTLSAHHTFGEAVQLMTSSPFRHFLVVHADERLAGVFSDRDVLRALGRTPNWQAKNVSEAPAMVSGSVIGIVLLEILFA